MRKYIVNVLKEFNDSPKDFIEHLVITAIALGLWGLITGILEEYR